MKGRGTPPRRLRLGGIVPRLLERLHDCWVYFCRRLTNADGHRGFRHPDLGEMGVDKLLAYCAWHGRHHLAHITELRKREGWGQ